ncbi:MAG: M15 family metallopeptidase domain-containing protein [Erysipelotrichaceae bacterium]
MINSLDKLNPDFKPIAEWIINTAKDKYKTNLVVNETLRTNEVQKAYYAQGREPIEDVNILREQAKLYRLTKKENKNKITNVKEISTTKGHGAGLAMDVIPDGNWNSPKNKWGIIELCVIESNIKYQIELEKIKSEIVWGGKWKKLNDCPHIELVRR